MKLSETVKTNHSGAGWRKRLHREEVLCFGRFDVIFCRYLGKQMMYL